MNSPGEQSAAFYRALIENAPGGTVLLRSGEAGWRICYQDSGAGRMLGYEPGELEKFDPSDLTHPEDLPFVLEQLQKVIENGGAATARYRFKHKSGSFLWIESTFSNMLSQPDVQGLVINSRDISEEKRAEDQAAANADMFRFLADQAPVLIWMSGTDKLCYHFNKVWLDFAGRTLEQEMGNGWAAGVHPDDYARCLDIYVTNFDLRKPFSMEYRLRHKSGEYRWILDNGSPVYKASGEFSGYIGSCTDITDLKAAQKALAESEKRLRTIVANEPECVKVVSKEGRVLDMNAAGLAMLEADRLEQVTNVNVLDFIAERHRAAFAALHERVMKGESATLEFEVIGRKGTHRWLETHAVPLYDDKHNVQYHLAVTRDVTDRRALADQLLQSQKLSSLGTLASGVAHDFNNILAIILGYMPLLERQRQDEASFRSTLASVQTAAERAAALVQQLLTFAHKTEFKPRAVDVRLMLSEISAMLRQTFPRNIAIEHSSAGDLPPALFDPNQFHQVMMNLCINARDAMPQGGTLKILAECVQGEKFAGRFPGINPRPYIRIVVADSGVGMDENTLAQIFEPFFTTKRAGRGTGLGLSVVHSILQQHGGFIEYQSTPGEGTQVLLYIPTTTTPGPETREQGPASIKGQGTVLFIEDEEMLREITQELLSEAGYTVLTAPDAQEGIDIFSSNNVDLVITDLGLPGMGGDEVVARLKQIKPDARIIVCTGFADPSVISYLNKENVPILQKPYRAVDLLSSIARALEQGRQQTEH